MLLDLVEWDIKRLCARVVHHELFTARSLESLGWAGTAVTPCVMNGVFVTRKEVSEGMIKLHQVAV